jgi:hypothetical protein
MENKTQSSEGFGLLGIVVALAVVALVGFGWWYVWQARTQKNSPTNTTATTGATSSNQTSSNSNQNVFKIPELGVEFEVKGGITPLVGNTVSYQQDTLSGKTISVKKVTISTQQVIDQGAKEAAGGKNSCAFDAVNGDPSLVPIYVYNSMDDAVLGAGPGYTSANINPSQGFFNIQGKVFFVKQVPISGTPCTTTPEGNQIEHQQWQYLHDSLMTLKAIE